MKFVKGLSSWWLGLAVLLNTFLQSSIALPVHSSQQHDHVPAKRVPPPPTPKDTADGRKIPVYKGPKGDDDCPTLAGVRDYVNENVDVDSLTDKNFIFWTGFDDGLDKSKVTTFIETKLNGQGVWFEDPFFLAEPNARYSFFVDGQFTGVSDKDRWKLVARPSQIYAEFARNNVYLFIPNDRDPKDPYAGKRFANWVLYEMNTITRANDNVDAIIRVDPDTLEPGETIWKKGDPPIGERADTDSAPVYPPSSSDPLPVGQGDTTGDS